MAIYQLGNRVPRIDPAAFVHELACVIGDITLGPDVTIWPFATLRGDVDAIEIGARTSIQDGSVLHTDEGFPMKVGARVTIGHQVMLHGCTVDDDALIGIQSIVLNGAHIGAGALIAAGSIVTEGRTIAPRSLAIGAPAKVVRELTDEIIARMRVNADGYVERGRLYRDQLKRIG